MLAQTLIKYSSLFLQNIGKKDIRIFLESSPLYPNLLSVLQTLKYVGLDVQAGQCDWEYLKNLKSPFLIHLKLNSKEILAISMWDQYHNALKILHPTKNTWEINNKENLADVWDGVVIYTDASPIRNICAKKYLTTAISIALFILILCATIIKYGIQAINTIPVLSGLAVSLCIYWQKYISPISIVNKICHFSSATDCDTVENSKYGNFGGLTLNCIALSYFLSQLSCIVMSCIIEINNAIYTIYLIAVVAVVPMTAYSICSQYMVRKICPLCLMILTCVVLQAVLFVYMPSQHVNFGLLIVWAIYEICFLCLFSLHSHKRLNQQEQLSPKIENLKLKRNKDVLLIESSYLEQVKTPLSLGTDTSSINISTIISPSCPHCRKIVFELLSLIERGIEFQWNIILGKISSQDSKEIEIWINEYFSDKNKFIHDLRLWSNGKIQNLSTISKLSHQNLKSIEICRDYNRQIERLNISGFPQIILNSRLLSSVYTGEDIKFLIADLTNKI